MQRWINSPLVVAGLSILLIVGFIQTINLWRRFSDLRQTEATLEEKLASVEAENRELRSELEIGKTPEAIERDAKARLNLKKSGEEVVIVVPPSLIATSTPVASSSWWQSFISFWGRLFGRD
ncbi:MAG: hypothetical protein A3H71_03165 [Candidatus Sungbacteria bacterium RIFCSPLOWO2_02_FULL_48_13b]|uniref:Cell division protein FtsL n=2 Tax=Candidatus Sungiibacteriota TaxID=1817917 RepID=A0A1G2LHC8_9BACT|nr:MAG: hypothetical protein A3C12_00175 [Candidatus Sungbacteria bacterium RIFCSPHIGHO2_02_FULL_49_20]OHA10924.1 MAG: hypothetical protein A3H71_03165 [Candidatus Sungbacteria bacterium RIFCSPLOWO2_02_FULL_48_13b]